MVGLTLGQKATAFRSLSASIYLWVAIASFHYAFSGLFHFPIGLFLMGLSLAMVVANVRSMLPQPNAIVDTLEDYHFNGETIFTFNGRCFVDFILVIGLIFFEGRILLAILVGGLIAAVIAVKDREIELFNFVFGNGGNNSISGNNGEEAQYGQPGVQYSVGDNTTGGYQSVDSMT